MMATTTKEATGAQKAPEVHWAEHRATRALERRRQRQAEQQATADVEAARGAVPLEVLRQRFAQLAAPIAEAVARWSETAAIALDSEATPGSLRLATFGGVARAASLVLTLLPDAGGVRVRLRGPSSGDERTVGLDDDAFEPESIARALAEEFLGHAEAIMALTPLGEVTR